MKRMIVALLILAPGCVTNGSKYVQREFWPDGTLEHEYVIVSRTYATAGSKLGVGQGRVYAYVDGHRVSVGQNANSLEAGGEPSKVIESAGPLILKGLELLAKP